jgi:hypothetical protein
VWRLLHSGTQRFKSGSASWAQVAGASALWSLSSTLFTRFAISEVLVRIISSSPRTFSSCPRAE